MNSSPLRRSDIKASSNYNNSPRKTFESLHSISQTQIGTVLSHHWIQHQQIHKIKNSNADYGSKDSTGVMISHPTLKKEGFSVYMQTLNKNYTNKNGFAEQMLTRQTTFEGHLPLTKISHYQIDMLEDEIKYMRRKLMEAQNAEKELKLEFQIYRANVEINRVDSFASASNQSQQLQNQLVKAMVYLTEFQQQNNRLRSELEHLSNIVHSLQKEKKDKQQQANNLNTKLIELGKQLKEKTDKLSKNNVLLVNYDEDLSTLREENINLKFKRMEQENNQFFKNEIQRLNNLSREQQRLFQIVLKQKQSDLDRLKKEGQEILSKCNTEVKLLEQQLFRVVQESKLVEAQHNQHILKILHQCEVEVARDQQKLKEQYEIKMKQLIQSNRENQSIENKSLGKEEINHYGKYQKNQNQSQKNELQQNAKLRLQIEALKNQLLSVKSSLEIAIEEAKQKSAQEKQLKKDQYNHKLNSYMKEMEMMVENMDKISDNPIFCGTIPQQQEEYEKTNSVLQSDVNLTINCDQIQVNNNYNISDLIELDDKVNSYIQNSNRRNLRYQEMLPNRYQSINVHQ